MPDPAPPLLPTPQSLTMIDPATGRAADVPLDQVSAYQDQGFTPETPDQHSTRLSAETAEGLYGGARGKVAAGLAGVVRGATLGGSDLVGRLTGGEDAAIALRGYQEQNPGVSFGSELAGMILPTLLTGGAAAPAGLASRLGAGVAERAGGGLVGALAGGAAEGAIFGAGQGVSELALSQDPLTLEHAAAAISSNALYGAAGGAIGTGVFKGVEAGLGAAKRALDRTLAERAADRAAKEAASKISEIGPETDVSLLDRRGLKVARDQEIEAVSAAQEPERKAFVDELRASRDAAEAEKTWIATQGGRTREVRSIGRATLDADRRIDSLLKVEADLVDKPQRALSALRQQEQALGKLSEWGERETQRYLDEVAGARGTIRTELLDNKVDGFRFGKGGISRESPVIDDIVERLFQEKYPHPDRLPTNLQVLNAVPGALERNRALQDKLAKLAEAPTSPRLSAIDAAEDALGIKREAPSSALGDVLKVAASAVPFGGMAEKAAGALSGLRKAVGEGAERLGRATSTFLGKAGPAAGKAAKLAPPVATEVLSKLRYGESTTDDRGKRKPEPKTLAELYKARTGEIQAQVELAPDGTYKMKRAARERMAARLAGLGVVDPVAADRLETAGARRIAWLASQIPRRPDITAVQIGPDTYTPSDLAMRTWARKAGAADDPYGVLERAAQGRVTPTEVMTLRATAPEILQSYINQVASELSTLEKKLPYKRRLTLSILTGKPVAAATHPPVLRELQSMYAREPGTAGGTQEPTANPRFGSVKRSDPGTPAQRRAGMGPS
ncbi:MAG: hypothetical protein ABR520_11295 [Mycobacteriales bacterium]